MRNLRRQLSMIDTYREVTSTLEEDKPKFFKLVDENIDWDDIIPDSFWNKFYLSLGRSRKYSLEGFLKALLIQRVFGYTTDIQLLNTLKYSREMRSFCGFSRVPDADKITRFKQNFCDEIENLFYRLVDKTENICKELDPQAADCLAFDSTGIECYVAENNSKFMTSKLRQAKTIAKSDPNFNPYKGVYSLLPPTATVNPDVKQQYINGHFCYAIRAGIVTNGLGLVRHIDILDTDFKLRHPDLSVDKRSDDPDVDKEIGDSTALKPILSDFFALHPQLTYSTFLGDSAFDSYDNYSALMNDFRFDKAVIPLNLRNSAKSSTSDFDEIGRPLCPIDKTPFVYVGKSKGKNRSERLKWVCHKSLQVGSTRVCSCESPCTASSYGRCVYTYPNNNLRLYPGIARESDEWVTLYKKRVSAERTINYFKNTLILGNRKTCNTLTTKADLFLAGITQLLTVLISAAVSDPKCLRKVRSLVS